MSCASGLVVVLIALIFPIRCSGEDVQSLRISDGTQILFYLAEPPSNVGGASPLAIVLPGGPGDTNMALAALNSFGKPLAYRGWTAVAPVSPDKTAFLGNKARQIILFIRVLKRKMSVAQCPVLLAGASNGGIAAIQAASLAPSEIAAVIAAPGLVMLDVPPGSLRGVPVYLRIGAKDELQWSRYYYQSTKRLQAAGAKANTALLPEAGHGIPLNWNEIQSWLDTVLDQSVKNLVKLRSK